MPFFSHKPKHQINADAFHLLADGIAFDKESRSSDINKDDNDYENSLFTEIRTEIQTEIDKNGEIPDNLRQKVLQLITSPTNEQKPEEYAKLANKAYQLKLSSLAHALYFGGYALVVIGALLSLLPPIIIGFTGGVAITLFTTLISIGVPLILVGVAAGVTGFLMGAGTADDTEKRVECWSSLTIHKPFKVEDSNNLDIDSDPEYQNLLSSPQLN